MITKQAFQRGIEISNRAYKEGGGWRDGVAVEPHFYERHYPIVEAFEKDVRAGLEVIGPDRDKIDVNTLIMNNIHNCVLGQICGRYREGIRKFNIDYSDGAYGFSLYGSRASHLLDELDNEDEYRGYTNFQILNVIWVAVLTEKLSLLPKNLPEYWYIAEKIVDEGVTLLQHNHGLWYNKIDIGALNTYSGKDCILGQIYRDENDWVSPYVDGLQKLDIYECPGEYGFAAFPEYAYPMLSHLMPSQYTYFSALDYIWLQKILNQRIIDKQAPLSILRGFYRD